MAKKRMPKSAVQDASLHAATVGLPHVPPLYELKSPHKFLPFKQVEKRLANSRN